MATIVVARRIERDQMNREPRWTESPAVGSKGFVEKIKPWIVSRRETEVAAPESNVWLLRQPPTPYGQKAGVKSGAKADI